MFITLNRKDHGYNGTINANHIDIVQADKDDPNRSYVYLGGCDDAIVLTVPYKDMQRLLDAQDLNQLLGNK